ncbi:CaiB/BaiF CoA-transferase family protein [Parafrankia sp. FMc6]|uniref:CaiB/BaiF CoA transferase family protein n=1 Tax=Parafrankia soli TaxID=2599596 RepID=UPI0034D70712
MTENGGHLESLAGVRVLDLSRQYPGSFCTLLLADLGADVVKVEPPGSGDGIRRMAREGQFNAAHHAVNRGKRSIVLDQRKPSAVSVLGRLVAHADVVLESNRPGHLDTLGLGYEAMRVHNPRLVWCSLTGFGDFGPNAMFPGHDLTYLGYSGLLSYLADGPATPPGTVLSLPLAGLMAAVGILAALLEARRTGAGSRVEANMTDSAMWTLSEGIARAANASSPGWSTFSARNVYTCADGRQVTVAATEPRTWARLCEALEIPELREHRFPLRAR